MPYVHGIPTRLYSGDGRISTDITAIDNLGYAVNLLDVTVIESADMQRDGGIFDSTAGFTSLVNDDWLVERGNRFKSRKDTYGIRFSNDSGMLFRGTLEEGRTQTRGADASLFLALTLQQGSAGGLDDSPWTVQDVAIPAANVPYGRTDVDLTYHRSGNAGSYVLTAAAIPWNGIAAIRLEQVSNPAQMDVEVDAPAMPELAAAWIHGARFALTRSGNSWVARGVNRPAGVVFTAGNQIATNTNIELDGNPTRWLGETKANNTVTVRNLANIRQAWASHGATVVIDTAAGTAAVTGAHPDTEDHVALFWTATAP